MLVRSAERLAIEREAIATKSRDLALVVPITRAFKAKKADGSEGLYLEAPASSTVVDRMGDRISLLCLQAMAKQATSLTLWLNHSYDVPEDVAGTIEQATLVTARDAAQGDCYDLMVRCEIDGSNPRAAAAYKHIENGRKLGLSIGGFIQKYDIVDTPAGDLVFTIEDLDLFEISLVGIPANQRAVVSDVAKGLRKRLGASKVDPTITAAQRKALARGVTYDDADPPVVAPDAEPEQIAPLEAPIITEAPAEAPAEEAPQAPLPAYSSVTVATTKAGRTISQDTATKLAAVKKCIMDATSHGVCALAKDSLDSALDGLNVISDTDPGDPGEASEPVERALTQRRADLAALEAQHAELLKAIADGQAARDEIAMEVTFLGRMLGTLQDTPMPRKSLAYGGAYRTTSSTDPDRRRMSEADLFRTALAGGEGAK